MKTQNNPNQAMSKKEFTVVTGIFCVICFAILVYKGSWDSDMTWLIATGRDILENGIPHTNTFNAYDGLGIVVQQWLYCVILALFDKIGYAGIWLYGAINISILGSITYLYIKRQTNRKMVSICVALFLMLYFSASGLLISPRPEAITISLLLTECILLEKYMENRDARYLAGVPLLMLMEANLHGSMIWAHYAVILAYVVPFPKLENKIKKPVPIIITSVFMTISAFINPYGIDMILYIINSVRSGYSDYVDIIEMQQPNIISFPSLAILLTVLLVLACIHTHKLEPYQAWLAIGFSLTACFAWRNVIFLYITDISLLTPFLIKIPHMGEHLPDGTRKTLLPFLIAAIVVSGGMFSVYAIKTVSVAGTDMLETMAYYDILYDMQKYMKEENEGVTTDVVVFTGYNTGAYFEYAGFTNVYMDARPEILMESVNGVADIMPEYEAVYCKYVQNYDYNGTLDEAIRASLESYGFDYLIVQKSMEAQLYAWLEGAGTDSGYVIVMETETFALYEKK